MTLTLRTPTFKATKGTNSYNNIYRGTKEKRALLDSASFITLNSNRS